MRNKVKYFLVIVFVLSLSNIYGQVIDSILINSDDGACYYEFEKFSCELTDKLILSLDTHILKLNNFQKQLASQGIIIKFMIVITNHDCVNESRISKNIGKKRCKNVKRYIKRKSSYHKFRIVEDSSLFDKNCDKGVIQIYQNLEKVTDVRKKQ
jgi:hypothetical protein